jgi:hypothetical protein
MWGKEKKLPGPLRQGCNIIMCSEAANARRIGGGVRSHAWNGDKSLIAIQYCLCVVYYPWRIQHICQVNLA